jgi:hypothetical protein
VWQCNALQSWVLLPPLLPTLPVVQSKVAPHTLRSHPWSALSAISGTAGPLSESYHWGKLWTPLSPSTRPDGVHLHRFLPYLGGVAGGCPVVCIKLVSIMCHEDLYDADKRGAVSSIIQFEVGYDFINQYCCEVACGHAPTQTVITEQPARVCAMLLHVHTLLLLLVPHNYPALIRLDWRDGLPWAHPSTNVVIAFLFSIFVPNLLVQGLVQGLVWAEKKKFHACKRACQSHSLLKHRCAAVFIHEFRLNQSVHRACRAHKCRNATHLCFDLLFSYSRLAENNRFCYAGVRYCSSFSYSTRYSQFLSFPQPKFNLVPFPTFIPRYFHISAHYSRRYGSKQVLSYFISGYQLKKRSWLSAFDLKRSGTRK